MEQYFGCLEATGVMTEAFVRLEPKRARSSVHSRVQIPLNYKVHLHLYSIKCINLQRGIK